MKESIDIFQEQIIEITDGMKEIYPSLKKYNEILITGKRLDWWDADRYAFENKACLPNRNELKDIWKIINSVRGFPAWTNTIRNESTVYTVFCDGKVEFYIKHNCLNVFCVRQII